MPPQSQYFRSRQPVAFPKVFPTEAVHQPPSQATFMQCFPDVGKGKDKGVKGTNDKSVKERLEETGKLVREAKRQIEEGDEEEAVRYMKKAIHEMEEGAKATKAPGDEDFEESQLQDAPKCSKLRCEAPTEEEEAPGDEDFEESQLQDAPSPQLPAPSGFRWRAVSPRASPLVFKFENTC